jgi:serine-type D-Ala-D-Ala carboxypeptidase
MKTFRRIALATLLSIVTLSSSTQVETRAVAQTGCSYDFSAVTALIQNAVNSIPLDGASLMLIKDGQVIYEQYFGDYNADTRVFIASASKWLSAATLMALVDEGKLSLDDPVSKYLTYFTGVKGAMTIRQMFSHTSGLPGIRDDARCLGNPFTTMNACARQIAQLELLKIAPTVSMIRQKVREAEDACAGP